ncbi:MAG: phosphodiesterase [Rhodospirillales bacterium]
MLIAQISDTHLRASGRLLHGQIDTARALDACIAHLRRLDPAPDLVLATGDLADGGLPEEYARLRAAFDQLPMPVYVIPGNHDDREALRSSFADHGYLPAHGEFLHYTIEDFPLRLIGLDTVIPGEVGGALCPARLAWLGERLDEQPKRPTLIFMHHPPFPTGIGFMDWPPLYGASELQELVRRHPQVRQVVCGHIHRAIHVSWAGTTAAVAPSVVYQMNLALRPDDGFLLIDQPPAIALYLWRREFASGPVGYVSLIGRRENKASLDAGPSVGGTGILRSGIL